MKISKPRSPETQSQIRIPTRPKQSALAEIKPTRRQLLSFLGVLSLSSIAGCTSTIIDQLKQNFNLHKYSPFEKEAYREEKPINPEQIGPFLQQLLLEYLDLDLDLSQIMEFKLVDGNVSIEYKSDIYGFAKKYELIIGSNGIIEIRSPHLRKNNHEEDVTLTIYPAYFESSQEFPVALQAQIKRKILNQGSKEYFSSAHLLLGDGSKCNFQENGAFIFQTPAGKEITIHNAQSLLKFLRECKSLIPLELTLKGQCLCSYPEPEFEKKLNIPPPKLHIDFSDVTIEDLIEMFNLLPQDPAYLNGFFNLSLEPKENDQGEEDQFRDPVTTLRSGWADCDDYALISALWAYLHRYQPSLVYIINPKTEKEHVFITFTNEADENVFLDDWAVTVNSGSVQEYIDQVWPGSEIETIAAV